MHTFFSIITSTYNAAATLQKCLDSVQKQTFADVEHIIIDGASTDGTVDIIKINAQNAGSRISYWISEPDKGIYDAWNKALPHIHGEWVLFLGADDWLIDNNILMDISNVFNASYPNNIVLYGKVLYQDINGEQTILGEPWLKLIDKVRYTMVFPHQATFHNRQLFDNNIFNTNYKIAADYDFLRRSIVQNNMYDNVIFIDRVITVMCAGGISAKNPILRILEIISIVKSQGNYSDICKSLSLPIKVFIYIFLQKILGNHTTQIIRRIKKKYADF